MEEVKSFASFFLRSYTIEFENILKICKKNVEKR